MQNSVFVHWCLSSQFCSMTVFTSLFLYQLMFYQKFLEINLVIIQLQNVKGVFDAAIRMVIKPPQKQHEKRKKPRQGCFLSVHFFLYYINYFVFCYYMLQLSMHTSFFPCKLLYIFVGTSPSLYFISC
jgi:hypothetical protein